MISGAIYKMRECMTKILRGCYQREKNASEAGFSLIELAIVMVIIGLLVAPLIGEFGRYLVQKHRDNTQISLRSVDTAISDYYSEFGFYPCPSDRSIAFGQPGHGVSDCTIYTAIGANSCGGSGGQPGYCRATQGAGEVLIGGVPYATLGIPFTESIDGWNQAMTYAVTRSMTVDAATFDPANGVVSVRDEFGAAANFHGVVVSAGANGSGAFNIEGTSQPCNLALVESENCNNDGVFLNSLRYSEAQNANYYDDIIKPRTWSASGIWTYTEGSASDVHSLNTGNVGVGTTTPTVKLEVVGNLKTEEVHSNQFCNADGSICFQADFIGGTGDQCNGNLLMNGIANNRVQCTSAVVTPGTNSCPSGQFMTGISGSSVTCATP